MAAEGRQANPLAALLGVLALSCLGVSALEYLYRHATERGAADRHRPFPGRQALATYERARTHVLSNFVLYGAGILFLPPLVYLGLRKAAQRMGQFRERRSGMMFSCKDYALPNPFDQGGGDAVETARSELARAIVENPAAHEQAVIGFDPEGKPTYLSDRARTMHVHLLGQTGSGKTQSVIYPLLFQDAWRPHLDREGCAHKRPILFLDAKGSAENEEMLCRFGAAAGRAEDVRLFTLNPGVPSQTYNPLYLGARADPRAMAERVFSTFAPEMDEPYYRDMARELFLNLVAALASTGKAFSMLDVIACVADEEVLLYGLEQASDRGPVRRIKNRLQKLAGRYDQTYSGLLAALSRYDHPAVNVYEPDIRLEEDLEAGRIVGFSLSANAYKFLARAIGLVVLQHLQQIGAARQMDRSRSQVPVSVFADEFYTFAYEGFVDAVNKLRDANISLLLSHQSLADLDQVSREYARAIWDNTRNKIVLYSNDADLCDRLASSMGTERGTELTIRRAADGWLNQVSMLEASSREVDAFVLHPSQLKNLRVGQAYLVQAGVGDEPHRAAGAGRRKPNSAARAVGLNLAMLPGLAPAQRPMPKRADRSNGLRLYESFVEGA